jgi:hypothetical protein
MIAPNERRVGARTWRIVACCGTLVMGVVAAWCAGLRVGHRGPSWSLIEDVVGYVVGALIVTASYLAYRISRATWARLVVILIVVTSALAARASYLEGRRAGRSNMIASLGGLVELGREARRLATSDSVGKVFGGQVTRERLKSYRGLFSLDRPIYVQVRPENTPHVLGSDRAVLILMEDGRGYLTEYSLTRGAWTISSVGRDQPSKVEHVLTD